MVYRLPLHEMPSKQLLCDQDVFEHVWASSRPRVPGDSHHDVAGFVSRTPPFQFPLASPTSVLQPPHISDLACFAFPQAQRSFALQAGHRRCRLEGWKILPHSVHCLSAMTQGISGMCRDTGCRTNQDLRSTPYSTRMKRLSGSSWCAYRSVTTHTLKDHVMRTRSCGPPIARAACLSPRPNSGSRRPASATDSRREHSRSSC